MVIVLLLLIVLIIYYIFILGSKKSTISKKAPEKLKTLKKIEVTQELPKKPKVPEKPKIEVTQELPKKPIKVKKDTYASYLGKQGEQEVIKTIKKYLKEINEINTILLNDLIFDIGDETFQVDHIFITLYGLIVIETKNYSGFVCGKRYDLYWEHEVHDVTYQFYNPIIQNKYHIKKLKEILPKKLINILPIFNLVIFTDKITMYEKENCIKLKSLPEYLNNLKLFNNKVIISNKSLHQIKDIILHYVNTSENRELKHIQNVQKYKIYEETE